MMECRRCRLSDIGKIVSGATPKTADPNNFGGSIAWITPADLSGYKNKYISHGAKSITEKGYNSCSTQLMPAGSVLFSSRAPIGYVAIAKNPVCTNQGFKSIIPDKYVDSEYLYYQLIYLRKHIQDLGSGTTFKEISEKKFAQVEVIVPPLLEQKHIVSRIEELFSQLDIGVETLKKTKQQLAVYRKTVYVSELNKCPKKTFMLKEVVETVEGDRGREYPKREELFKDGYCLFLTAKNVSHSGWRFTDNCFIKKEKDEALHSGRVELNDVIITTRGTLGNVVVYDTSVPFDHMRINSCMLILRPYTSVISPCYLAQYLSSPLFKVQVENKKSGTAQPQIPARVLKDATLGVPSLEDQEMCVRALNQKLSVCDSIEQTIDAALQQAEVLRQSILKKAFEGEL